MTLLGDKSISHRVAIMGALVNGDTTIINYSPSQEFEATLRCLTQYGVEIEYAEDEKSKLIIHGKGLEGLIQPEQPLDAGNSSATVRLLMGLASACPFETVFEGSEKLKARPMLRIIEPMEKMGATVESDNYRVPLRVLGGNLQGIKYIMPLSTSQVKGAVFTAGLYAEGKTELVERIPCRDHFERLMAYMGIKFKKETAGKILSIPGDVSAAALFVAAGVLVKNSDLVIDNVCLNPTRIGFLDILEKMRANISFEAVSKKGFEPTGQILAKYGPLKGRRIVGETIPSIIDELPIMAVIATQAQGTTVIRDAFELRHKETDRIKTVVSNLRKMGARIGELEDGMAIDGGTELEGAEITTFGDHRIAMAFAIAGLIAKGETVIKDAECVATSHPTFWEDLDSIVEY